MVTQTVSQNKYIVGPVERFDQKNDMFKRTRWDPTLREMAEQLWGVAMPSEKEGFTPWLDPWFIKADDLLGYHKPVKPRDYWTQT